jgi:hypothetical protein
MLFVPSPLEGRRSGWGVLKTQENKRPPHLDTLPRAGARRFFASVNSHPHSGWLDFALKGRKQKIRSVEVAFFMKTITIGDGFHEDNKQHAETPIQINDGLIAAHAAETGAMLITYDTHLSKVPGLRLLKKHQGM